MYSPEQRVEMARAAFWGRGPESFCEAVRLRMGTVRNNSLRPAEGGASLADYVRVAEEMTEEEIEACEAIG
jgi:hypothetical protein